MIAPKAARLRAARNPRLRPRLAKPREVVSGPPVKQKAVRIWSGRPISSVPVAD